MGQAADSVVICSEPNILNEQQAKFSFTKLRSNVLYEINDSCLVESSTLTKKIKVSRKAKLGYSHIFEEEIFESIDAMSRVHDDGAKFISAHQVVLGGFDRAKEELSLI